LLQHAFGNLARMFSENWEFDLSNLQSAGVWKHFILIGRRNGTEPYQLFTSTAFLHTFVYNQYKKECLTAGITINNECHHLNIQPKSIVMFYLQSGIPKILGDP
jgi:hypothetical protein